MDRDHRVLRVLDRLNQPAIKPDLTFCSEECLELIRKWTRTCDDNHSCNVSSPPASPSSDEYPTSFIDVGTDSAPSLRICEGKYIPGNPRYMTLSHCWGQEKFFTRSTSNLTDLKTAIPEEKLTKTHREAISSDAASRLQIPLD
jgi:hypothetical protein